MQRNRLTVGPKQVRYVCVDVVGFSKDRSLEAQADIMKALNEVVNAAVVTYGCDGRVVFLPSGDEVCICMDPSDDPDIDLRLAVSIHELVAQRSNAEPDPERRFDVRIGLNENTDNVIVDIEGRRNFVGPGVNHCHEIMRLGDGRHLLVSSSVFNRVGFREPHKGHFYTWTKPGKHGDQLSGFQYRPDLPYVSSDTPKAFARNADSSAVE